MSSWLLIVVVLSLLLSAEGRPSRLCTTECWKPLSAGTTYMSLVSIASNSRTVQVSRGGTVLSSGDSYVYGETLTVTITPWETGLNFVFEAENGAFTSGGCTGAIRIANTVNAVLTTPSSGALDLSIWTGYTMAKATPIQISDKFVLRPPPSSAPTVTPTASPTASPTESPTAAPTESPTASPTEGPTADPTHSPTHHPTHIPTFRPTRTPSHHPTHHPTATPSQNPTPLPSTSAPSYPITEIPTALPTEAPTGPSTEPTISPTAVPTDTVTQKPTAIPTGSPTELPTELPTEFPTEAPTDAPTTLDPTAIPTAGPTSRSPSTIRPSSVTPSTIPTREPTTKTPSNTPTFSPTPSPTTRKPTALAISPTAEDANAVANSESSLSDKSTPEKVIAGVLIGIASAIVLLYGSFHVANRVMEANEDEDEKVMANKDKNLFSKFASFVSFAMVILSIILVSKWASDGNIEHGDPLYLGKPSWEKNAKAYHVSIMVGGFYSCQILAISCWTLIPQHYAAKICHAIFQVFGLAMMIAGLWSILKYKYSDKSPNFTTMHSWVGIAGISMYGLNFAWGSVMAFLTQFFPNSVLRKAYDLRAMHKNIGTFALWMVNISILTGIMSHLSYGSCYPPSYGYTKPDYDSAQNFDEVPDGCKIGHGIGISVLIGTLSIMLAVSYRVAKVEEKSALIYPTEGEEFKLKREASYEAGSPPYSHDDAEMPL